MPVGVPKVPYGFDPDQPAEWVDLYNRLYRDRVLFLCQDLEEELTNQLVGIMLYLNGEESKDGVFIYINSLGGALICGISVSDIMNYIEADVTTICVGSASSMASFVLANGGKGNRISLPNSRLMIHQPAGGMNGQTSIVISEAEEIVRLRNDVIRIYADRTGQSLETIDRDMHRDEFMSAREAKQYGLVDQVASEMY